MFKAESYVGYKLCWPGDLVINSLWAWAQGLGVSRYHGIVSSAYGNLSSKAKIRRIRQSLFMNWSVQTPFQWELQVRSKGIWKSRLQLTDEAFLGAPLPLPPPEDRTAIVRFLGYYDRKIRRYIRAKQRLIKLLEEKKQAIIHRAVTRGLDPNVRLSSKPGFFLDELPSNWPIFRAKQLFRQVEPVIPDNAEIVTCFRDGRVTLRRNRRTTGFTNALKELGYQGIKPGQLVLHSMDAFAGAIGVSDSAGKCSPEYVICEPAAPGMSPHYYAHLLRSLALCGLFVVICDAVRERAPRVRFTHLGAFSLPKPSLEEQIEIVEHILASCGRVDYLLEKTRREIDLLSEYRTRLIADIVTGKLDIREATAQLRDEAEQQESFDEAEMSIDNDELSEDADEDNIPEDPE